MEILIAFISGYVFAHIVRAFRDSWQRVRLQREQDNAPPPPMVSEVITDSFGKMQGFRFTGTEEQVREATRKMLLAEQERQQANRQ